MFEYYNMISISIKKKLSINRKFNANAEHFG